MAAPPANLQGSYQSATNSIEVNWDPVYNATAYKLYWDNQWGVTTNSNYGGEISAPGTSYTHQGVTGGLEYYYRVLSVTPAGESELSSWDAYVYVPVIAPPGNLAASYQNATNSIQVAWDPVHNATSYKLYWANQWGVTTNSNYAGEISGTSYAHQGVTGGQFYIYRVLSVGPPGESELSWEAYVYVP